MCAPMLYICKTNVPECALSAHWGVSPGCTYSIWTPGLYDDKFTVHEFAIISANQNFLRSTFKYLRRNKISREEAQFLRKDFSLKLRAQLEATMDILQQEFLLFEEICVFLKKVPQLIFCLRNVHRNFFLSFNLQWTFFRKKLNIFSKKVLVSECPTQIIDDYAEAF